MGTGDLTPSLVGNIVVMVTVMLLKIISRTVEESYLAVSAEIHYADTFWQDISVTHYTDTL